MILAKTGPSISRARGMGWGVAALLVFILAGTALYRFYGDASPAPMKDRAGAPGSSGGKSAAIPNPEGAVGASTPATTPPDASAQRPSRDETVFHLWRSAILAKNPSQVYAAEAAFLGHPTQCHEGLAELAEKDPEERVRVFSTRVLGKLAIGRDIDLFTRLVQNDSSPNVRQNAAWALGQLGQTASAEVLRRVSEGDPNKDVREAAAGALGRTR